MLCVRTVMDMKGLAKAAWMSTKNTSKSLVSQRVLSWPSTWTRRYSTYLQRDSNLS